MSTNFFKKISEQKSSSRIAINTFIIYAQRISGAALSLITTPIILNALGVEDYGLYALTVGFVGMLAFVNWSLSSATKRYIAFAIGEGSTERLKKIFASSLFIHVLYGLLLLIIIVIFGSFLVENFLSIPEERISAAKTIIIFVSVITFFNIITVPFHGLFRAHENFLFLAIIGIVESLLKLAIAIFILFIDFDKLISYSALLLLVSLLIFLLNSSICRKFYAEVNFSKNQLDTDLIKEMLGFIGWNQLGALAILSRNQGVSVLLNLFFGVVANAAYGIALQVKAAIGILSHGIIGSISPQMVKSAGAREVDKMIYLMRTMSKFAVITTSIIALPLIIEAPFILKLWLKTPPDGSVLFSQLMISFSIIMLFSAGIQNVFESIGRVKLYNLWVSLILMLNLPIAYVFFKLGFAGHTIILTGILLEIVSLFVRLFLLKKYVSFSIATFLNDMVLGILLPLFAISSFIILIKQAGLSEHSFFFITFGVMFTLFPVLVYKFSLDKRQKEIAAEIIFKSLRAIKFIKE